MKTEIELPDEQVKIVISNCNKCKHAIRLGVEHMMDKEDFYKEVVKYNLTVKTLSLIEYRANKPTWCDCE